MEVWFIGHRGVAQAHLLALIRTKSIEVALCCERQRVTITTTDLSHFVREILYTSRFFNHGLTTEHSVSQAELSLAIISKGVQMAYLSE